MNYCTMEVYETQRETKFIFDMQYGLFKRKSCLISEISRTLSEDIKLKSTIKRLCDNLQSNLDLHLQINVYLYFLGSLTELMSLSIPDCISLFFVLIKKNI